MMEDSNVIYTLKKLKKEADHNKLRTGIGEKRFTVTLSEYDMTRLENLVKILDSNRLSLSRELLISALDDAEKTLGLNLFEGEGVS